MTFQVVDLVSQAYAIEQRFAAQPDIAILEMNLVQET